MKRLLAVLLAVVIPLLLLVSAAYALYRRGAGGAPGAGRGPAPDGIDGHGGD